MPTVSRDAWAGGAYDLIVKEAAATTEASHLSYAACGQLFEEGAKSPGLPIEYRA